MHVHWTAVIAQRDVFILTVTVTILMHAPQMLATLKLDVHTQQLYVMTMMHAILIGVMM